MKNRLLSIDVFRGMTIAFMIIVNTPGSWSYVYPPLRHSSWHGCTPTDLVFPFFIIAIGLSMAFSFTKFNPGDTSKMIKKIAKRSLLIFVVGVLLNWFPFYTTSPGDLRFFGVLQRIAISYFIAGIMVTLIKKDNLLLAFSIFILLMYWLILMLGGDYTLGGNVNNIVDQMIVPGKNLYGGYGIPFDPEGLLGSISSASQIVIGYFFGLKLLKNRKQLVEFLKFAALWGFGFILAGVVWGQFFPINKSLWTSSYVIYTSGIAILFFALLVWLIDMKSYAKWGMPFKVFGRNSLFSYVLSGVIVNTLLFVIKLNGTNAYDYLYVQVFQPIFGNFFGSFLFAIANTIVVYVFALFLYKKEIWVKL